MSHGQEMELFWGLSHAQYLTIPRSVIQLMSVRWQKELATLLDKLDETIDWRPKDKVYYCFLLDEEMDRKDIELLNEISYDQLSEYRHGNDYAKSLIRNGD